MRFAKVVFWIAGIWGVLVIAPLFFLLDAFNRQMPPAITHSEFYYGFAVVTLAWQLGFFVIAVNPRRFRPLMIPPALAKLGFAATVFLLQRQGSALGNLPIFALADIVLAILFFVAFFMTTPRQE